MLYGEALAAGYCVSYLEHEAAYHTRGLKLLYAICHKQGLEHTIVSAHKFGESYYPRGLLYDECSELRHYNALVVLKVLNEYVCNQLHLFVYI